MMFRTFILGLIVIFGICACSSDLSDEEIEKSRINDVLLRVRDGFNDLEINSIMEYYDQDFLHDGKNKFNEEYVWNDRLSQYNYLELTDIDIEYGGDFAVVHFIAKYSKSGSQAIFIEPDDIGDMSYFRKIGNEWKIYGDQHD